MNRSITKCAVFQGLEHRRVEALLSEFGYEEESFAKGDVVAIKGARYTSLMILVDGSLSVETTDVLGQVVAVEHITSPAVIAPDYLFAEGNTMPVDLSARTVSKIVRVGREAFCDMMCRDRSVMTNFMALLSSSNRFMSEKVLFSTYKTIKGKYASYLLRQAEKENSMKFRNTLTQEEMAAMFGVTRPALARAIGELADDGAIYVKGKEVKILFPEKLRQYTK